MVASPIEAPPKSGAARPISRHDDVAALGTLLTNFVPRLSHDLHVADFSPTHCTTTADDPSLCLSWNVCSDEGILYVPYRTNYFARPQDESEASQVGLHHTAPPYHGSVCPLDLELHSGVLTLEQKGYSSDDLGNLSRPWPQGIDPLSQENEHHSVIKRADGSHGKPKRSNDRHLNIIKIWLSEHALSPYPTRPQKEELLAATGLSDRQLSVCLSNFRARTATCSDSSYSMRSSSEANLLSASNINIEPGAMSQPVDYGSWECPQPWDTDSMGGSLNIAESSDELPWDGIFALNDPGTFATSTTDSPASSSNSNTYSHLHIVTREADVELVAQTGAGSRRKGKRRYGSRSQQHRTPASVVPVYLLDGSHARANRYHCTACTRSFKDSYSWKRHEAGVHGYIDIQWVCMLHNNVFNDAKCIFCSDVVHSMDHFEQQHNIHVCYGGDKAERTFNRKDRLKQHVLQKHLADANDYTRKGFEPPKSWSEQAEMSLGARWCGFCLQSLENTPARMKHVAQHFKDGWDMGAWVCRTT